MTEADRRVIFANIDKRRIKELEAENARLREIIKAMKEENNERSIFRRVQGLDP